MKQFLLDTNICIYYIKGLYERMAPEFRHPEIKEINHGNYRLVYELKTNQIDMLTIWHTRQMLPDDPHKIG